MPFLNYGYFFDSMSITIMDLGHPMSDLHISKA